MVRVAVWVSSAWSSRFRRVSWVEAKVGMSIGWDIVGCVEGRKEVGGCLLR